MRFTLTLRCFPCVGIIVTDDRYGTARWVYATDDCHGTEG